MDKIETQRAPGDPHPVVGSSGNSDHREAAGANGGLPADQGGEFDEEYQDYEEEEEFGGEGEEYEEDDGAGGDSFTITASGTEDFGEGLEGQEEDMLEDVRTKIREMEEEAEKLRQLQSESEKSSRPSLGQIGAPAVAPTDEKVEVDSRSVYVGQVEYSCTTEELEAHFRSCGPINRVTIMCDKYTGHPKGFAYIEFASKDSVDAAVALTDTTLKERQLKVVAKRTNQPGMGFAARRSRRPYPYRGGPGGYMRSRRPYRPYNPYYRGRSSYRGAFRGPYRRSRPRYAAY